MWGCFPPVTIPRLLLLVSVSFTEHMLPPGHHAIKLRSVERYGHRFCTDVNCRQGDIWSWRSSVNFSLKLHFSHCDYGVLTRDGWVQRGGEFKPNLANVEKITWTKFTKLSVWVQKNQRLKEKTDTTGKLLWVIQQATALRNVDDWPNNLEQLS